MKLEEAIKLLIEMRSNCLCEKKYEDSKRYMKAEAIRTVLQEIDHLQKENEELRIARDNYKGCFIVTKENSISKDNIREKIEKLKPQLEETDKRTEKAKVQEERIVLKCIGIRLDERIKTLQDLLKEE